MTMCNINKKGWVPSLTLSCYSLPNSPFNFAIRERQREERAQYYHPHCRIFFTYRREQDSPHSKVVW